MCQQMKFIGRNWPTLHGYAIEKMTETEAQSAWEIYDQILAAEDALARGGLECLVLIALPKILLQFNSR